MDIKNPFCLFCAVKGKEKIDSDKEIFHFSCNCTANKGWYSIDADLYSDLYHEYDDKQYPKHIISGYIREMIENGQQVHFDSEEKIKQILQSPLIPRYIGDKIDKLLVYLYRNTDSVGDSVILTNSDYNLTYSKKMTELDSLVFYLQSQGMIKCDAHGVPQKKITMTPAGLAKGYELLNRQIKSNQCFIAMSFDPDLLQSFKDHVFPRIRETGFEPLTVDMVHHNDDIVDRIIYEIKNSHFVIADFTHQKHGVYFEAGFAKGLGLEVIWTVREDYVESCHFDTRQMNHIVWRTVEELGVKLRDRILATIPGARLIRG